MKETIRSQGTATTGLSPTNFTFLESLESGDSKNVNFTLVRFSAAEIFTFEILKLMADPKEYRARSKFFMPSIPYRTATYPENMLKLGGWPG